MKVFPITKQRYINGLKVSTGHAAARTVLVAKSPLQQLTPFSRRETDTDSCVLANGLARSGTYLIHSIVTNLGKWEDIGVHINSGAWHALPHEGKAGAIHQCSPQIAVKKLRNGQVVAAHLPWSKALERSIGRVTPARRCKHVFIYRDPRDAFVSQLNWHTYSEKFLLTSSDGERRKFILENFSDDGERLTYFIENRFKWDYMSYIPWLHSSHCFAVKFEDLDADATGLRDGRMGDTLRNLLIYLEVDPDAIDPMAFFDKDLRNSHNSSSVEHKVGQWRRVFKEQHYAQLDTREFRDTLQAYGYEW